MLASCYKTGDFPLILQQQCIFKSQVFNSYFIPINQVNKKSPIYKLNLTLSDCSGQVQKSLFLLIKKALLQPPYLIRSIVT